MPGTLSLALTAAEKKPEGNGCKCSNSMPSLAELDSNVTTCGGGDPGLRSEIR